MTKRFTVIREVYQVYKDKTLYEVSDGTHTFLIYENAQELTDLLNELHEEKEQLQHDATILIQSNQDYRKENEQLKSTIKEVIELLEEEVDLFSDKALEHDICAYVELRELDNKDAYYMATATKKAIRMLKELI